MANIEESPPPSGASIVCLPGIGSRREVAIRSALGVRDLASLALVLPRAYEEPAPWRLLAEAEDGERIRAKVRVGVSSIWRRGRKSTLTVNVQDDSDKAQALWFQQPWLKDRFNVGEEICIEGRVSIKKSMRIISPKILLEDSEEEVALRPLYPKVEGVPPGVLSSAIHEAFLRVPPSEYIPSWLLKLAGSPPVDKALNLLHHPGSNSDLEIGRRRFALEEVVSIEKARLKEICVSSKYQFESSNKVWERILARIPFDLTADQEKVLESLRHDLASGLPVRRLLHGEVGSGKTAVAFALALAVVAGGGQVAVLAPTEILARQHVDVFCRWLKGSRVSVVSLFGDDILADRRQALRDIASGNACIAIGTHALFSQRVVFENLALIVFDEQHRFGVRQKGALLAKANKPHVLTMTATPIPRTLAWARYGALEPCVLRERVGASAEVVTQVRPLQDWRAVAAELRPRLESGEKLFLVLPRIDGSSGLLAEAERLSSGEWAGIPLEVVHGRLPGAETANRVERFVKGNTQVLAGTTVVELGLDVPGVPTMVVVGAERLGLASLHQLRGRISRGKGAPPGHCLIFAEESALNRLRLLEECGDGFQVAELDFELRGSGALHGTQQHGRSDFEHFRPDEDDDLIALLTRNKVRNWLMETD